MPGGVAEDQLREAGLEPQTGPPCGLFDRGAKVLFAHRGDEVHALREQGCEGWLRVAFVKEVGPHGRHHDPGRSRLGDEPAHRVHLVGREPAVEELLELVDDDDVGAPSAVKRVAKLRGDRGGGRDHPNREASTGEGGDDAREDERRLAASRWPRDRDERRTVEAGEDGRDVGIPTEELLPVIDPIRMQALVRAVRARLRTAGRRQERGILVQDRGLEGGELRAGLDPELGREPDAGGPQGGEGVGLPSAAVERGREQAPPTLAQRLLANQGFGARDHAVLLAAVEVRRREFLLGGAPNLLEARRLDDGRLP